MYFGAPWLGEGGGMDNKKNQSVSPFHFSSIFSFSPCIPLQVIYMEHFLFSSWRYPFFILRYFCCCLSILEWMCWDQQNHTYHFAFEAICLDKYKKIFFTLQEIAQCFCQPLGFLCHVLSCLILSDLRATLEKAASYRCLERFNIFFSFLKAI